MHAYMYELRMYDVCIYAFIYLKCKADLPQALQGVLTITVIPRYLQLLPEHDIPPTHTTTIRASRHFHLSATRLLGTA
jgi:hypothetical protein